MSKPILSDLDFGLSARILSLPDPTLAQHAATKAYVDSAVEGLAWKDSVRIYAPVNVNLAAPGASLDGIALAANDRFCAPNQTTGSQNGIYIFNGAAAPATRALDMNIALEVEQAVFTVEEGTSAGATFRQTQVNVTLDTTTLVFTSFGTSAPSATETVAGVAELATQAEADTGADDVRTITPLKMANWAGRKRKTAPTVIGDGSATSFNIDHNFNTRDVMVTVFKNSGNYDEVLVEKTRPTVNRVTLTFVTPPALNAYAVVVIG